MIRQARSKTMSERQIVSACPHPEAVGTRWGDPISAEHQAVLQGHLDRWEADADEDERVGPFDGGPRAMAVRLTGADVYWLAAHSEPTLDDPAPGLHLEGANLTEMGPESPVMHGGDEWPKRLDERLFSRL
jgi:hypothetical protein